MNRIHRFSNRWLAPAALGLLALLLLAPMTTPRVETVVGAVEIGRGEPPRWRAAQPGDALVPGDRIRTGAAGRAELDLGGRTVRLYPHSVLRLPATRSTSGAASGVDLEAGSSLFDVLRGAGAGFEVRTPEVVVSVKGTRFLVSAGAGASSVVSVFSGRVGVVELGSPAAGITVAEGFSARPGASGGFSLTLSDFGDPWEAWSQGAGPPVPTAAAPSYDAERALEAAIVDTVGPLLEVPAAAGPDGTLPASLAADAAVRDQQEDAALSQILDPVADIARQGVADSDGGAQRGTVSSSDGTSLDFMAAILGGGEDPLRSGGNSGQTLGSSGYPFSFEVFGSSGKGSNDHVIVEYGPVSADIDDGDLDDIEDGDFGSFGALLPVLIKLGIDPLEFGDFLDDLI